MANRWAALAVVFVTRTSMGFQFQSVAAVLLSFFICLLLGLVSSSTASAHPSPFSYIDVRLPGAAVELTVVAHIFDVAHDLGVPDEKLMLDAAELTARRDAIVALLEPRIQVWVDGRQAAGPVWSAPRPLEVWNTVVKLSG